MRYRTYLKERGIWAAVFGWLLFSIETFLLTMRGSLWLGIYVAVSLILAYVAGTYADYRHLKKYMEKLYHTTEELDKKYLLPEMMEPGARQEEKLLHQIVYMTNKSMNEQVARYKRSAKEYKEYIELWIHEVKVPIAAARMVLTNHPTETAVELETELCAIEGYTDQALYYARSSEVEKDYFIRQVHLQELVEETLLQKKEGCCAQGQELYWKNWTNLCTAMENG